MSDFGWAVLGFMFTMLCITAMFISLTIRYGGRDEDGGEES